MIGKIKIQCDAGNDEDKKWNHIQLHEDLMTLKALGTTFYILILP